MSTDVLETNRTAFRSSPVKAFDNNFWPSEASATTNNSLPEILDYILQLSDIQDLRNGDFLLAVSQLSVSQRSRIASFAHNLYHACGTLKDIGLPMDVNPSHTEDQENNNEGRLIESAHIEPANTDPIHNKPAYLKLEPANTESADNQPIHNEPSSEESAHIESVLAEPAHTYSDHGDDQPGPIEPTHTVMFRRAPSPKGSVIIVGKSESQPETGRLGQEVATSISYISSLKMPTSLKADLNMEPTLSASTPSTKRGISPTTLSKCSEPANVKLLEQSVDDLICTAYRQVQLFSLPRNSPETYTALFCSLNIEDGENSNQWSDGSQLASLLEAGDGERHMGALHNVLATIAFCRWHASQVEQLKERKPKKAAQEVSGRILGPKPDKDTASGQRWERHRKRINIHLTCGKKWSWLVKELGFGILLTDVW